MNIKKDPVYRRHAFEAGVIKHGFKLVENQTLGDGDLFITWNLHGHNETIAKNTRAAGGKVIVAENGVIGKDANGIQFYSMARDAHHAGRWHVGGQERWAALGIEVKPWASNPDGHVLICAQRGIGSKLMASPPRWHSETERILQRAGYKTKVRLHPGLMPNKAPTPLVDELRGARACAIWSSMSGIQALVTGIPVSYWAPAWVGSWGAGQEIGGIDAPICDDEKRMKALTAAAWYQWSVAEIEAGTPFEYLLKL